MSVSQFNDTGNLNITFSHTNSGFQPTTAGPTKINYAYSSTSGSCYLKQYALASGGVQAVDFVSGGLLDLTADSVNLKTILNNLQFLGVSGTVQMETYQSGALRATPFSTQSGYPSSGYGYLVGPGDTIKFGLGGSGLILTPAANNGNLNFRAVSGSATFQVSYYGV